MAGGPSQINLPNSHPPNPIQKAGQASQPASTGRGDAQTTSDTEPPAAAQTSLGNASSEKPQHEINKMAVIICVAIVAALLFMRHT